MKKTIISIIVAVVATFSAKAQTTIIDFDYSKAINYDVAWFDLDLDGEIDDDESKLASGQIYFNYKDFGSAGNLLGISLTCGDGTGKQIDLSANLEDVVLIYKTNDNREPIYMVSNKIKEPQIIVSTIDGQTFLFVFNLAIFVD